MKKTRTLSPEASALRQRAEQRLREHRRPAEQPRSETSARALVHELQVHQIELEMQNEELVRAQAGARQAADKYAELFDFAPVGYFVLDPRGLIREVNLAGAALLGLDRQRVAGQPFEQYVVPDLRAAFKEGCLGARTTEGRSSCETRLLRHGSVPCDVLIGVSPDEGTPGPARGCRLTVADITGRKRAEEALRRAHDTLEQRVIERTAELLRANEALRASEARLAAFAQATFEGIVESEAGRIVDCNEQFARISGYSAAELKGMSVAGLIAPEDRDQVMENVLRQRVSAFEHAMLRKDGALIFVEAHGQPVSPGSVRRHTVIRDITSRKRMEQDLLRSNQELEQFAYVASHDLQEPLRAVAGYVKLLQQRLGDQTDAKAREYIEGALEGALHMSQLIEDLLALSRVGTRGQTFKPSDLNAVLADTLHNLRFSIERTGAKITSGVLPTLAVDPNQIMELFQNLIGNAIKFCGGHPPEVHVTASRRDGRWIFAVRDNGIGIEPRHFTRIFQIFQRLHVRRKYPGTGLGLAICKKIIERHGGDIWVESQPAQGSTFYFSIPEIALAQDKPHED